MERVNDCVKTLIELATQVRRGQFPYGGTQPPEGVVHAFRIIEEQLEDVISNLESVLREPQDEKKRDASLGYLKNIFK